MTYEPFRSVKRSRPHRIALPPVLVMALVAIVLAIVGGAFYAITHPAPPPAPAETNIQLPTLSAEIGRDVA